MLVECYINIKLLHYDVSPLPETLNNNRFLIKYCCFLYVITIKIKN